MSDVIETVKQWLDQVVIGLNLCPFARQHREADQIRFVESLAQDEVHVLKDLYDELRRLDDYPASKLETTLLIFPHVFADFSQFNQFLDLADRLLMSYQWEGIFQIASFHPDYQFAGTDKQAKSNLTNRAPYPILHLLRENSVSDAISRLSHPKEIYQRNIQTMNALSDSEIYRLFPHLDQGDTLCND